MSSAEPSGQKRLEPSAAYELMSTQASEALELEAMGMTGTTAASQSAPERLLIGLVCHLHPVSDLLHPIFERVLYGVRTRLTASDCDLLLSATRPVGAERDFRAVAVEQTIDHGVAALVAWGMSNKGPEVKPILNSGLPAMFIDNDVIGEHIGYVMSANVEGCAQAVRHLHEAGRRRIAHIAGTLNTRPGPDRLFGYRSELEALGLTVPPEYVEQGDFMHTSGYEASGRAPARAARTARRHHLRQRLDGDRRHGRDHACGRRSQLEQRLWGQGWAASGAGARSLAGPAPRRALALRSTLAPASARTRSARNRNRVLLCPTSLEGASGGRRGS